MAGDRLREFTARPETAGVVLDFDGTLSEIAPTPDAARAMAGAAETLSALAQRFRAVAVVSGRRASEVAERLRRPAGVRIFGLYGLEDERGPVTKDATERAEAVARAILEVERAAAFVPATLVERKALQVAVHYRAAPDPEHARRVLLARLTEVAKRHGLEVLEGKRVIELAGGARPTKGDAVFSMARQAELDRVLYAGDDLADLEAFRAVAGMGGVRVAVRSDETPEELVAAADVIVEGPSGLLALLRELLA